MNFPALVIRNATAAVVALAAFGSVTFAQAHGASAGDVRIEHPYATPSLAGVTTGAAYFVALENTGAKADKLLGAVTPVAASVELHTMNVDAQGVMRMRQVDGIALAPQDIVKMQPGMGYHLMLVGLKRPLKDGESFPMTLQFERAGKLEVKVVVQAPKAAVDMPAMHMH